MKIIVFGVGTYWKRREKVIKGLRNVDITAFIDNNARLWKSNIHGVPILSPEQCRALPCDFIVLMAVQIGEMREQLLSLGIDSQKIIIYEKLLAVTEKNTLPQYAVADNTSSKSILIVSPELNYTGAPIAAFNLAVCLCDLGYHVVLAAIDADHNFSQNAINHNIDIVICKNLFYPDDQTMRFAKQFKYVIVNTFNLIPFVKFIGKQVHVIWWIHEPDPYFTSVFDRFGAYTDKDIFPAAVYGVSKIACDAFRHYFPHTEIGSFAYGIEDKYSGVVSKKYQKTIFAVIGYISTVKAQDVFLEAIGKLNPAIRDNAEFWIIGEIGTSGGFGQTIRDMAGRFENVQIIGSVTQEEMQALYDDIDVVVNCSRYDSLPTVVVEGMMNRKICIVSDATGIKEYITHQKNGLIVHSEDSEDLAQQMTWTMENIDNMDPMRQASRETFQYNFTLNCLKKRIKEIL